MTRRVAFASIALTYCFAAMLIADASLEAIALTDASRVWAADDDASMLRSLLHGNGGAASNETSAAGIIPRVLSMSGRPRQAVGPRVQPTAEDTPNPPCVISHDRQVLPLTPAKGDEVTLTLGISALCDPEERPLHAVLVIEATDRMGQVQVEKLSGALRSALQELGIEDRPGLKIGVVTIGFGKAQVRSFLTDDESRVLSALPYLADIGGDPCVPCGLVEALRVLWNGRGGQSADEIREVILLATVGIDQSGCDALQTSANQLKAHGALVVTACVGPSCDNRCLSEAASDVKFAFRSWDWSFVERRVTELVESSGPSFYPITGIHIEDWLAEGKLLYTGGGEPSKGVGNKLAWDFSPWPSEGVTRTYHAQAITCGRFRASESAPSAVVHFNETFWASVPELAIDLANPVLDVPCATTVTSSPSPAPSTTVTPSSTPAVTPEPTSDRQRSVVYLPSLLRLACAVERDTVDVILAIDVSGSMMLPAPEAADGTRLDVSRRISVAMLDHLESVDSRVGVVVYGDEELMQVLAPLADCCGAARIALDRLPRYNGSRMDLALEESMTQLAGPAGRPGAEKVIVVMTDGDLNRTPHLELIDKASAARAAGIALHIVGVGPEDSASAAALTEAVGSRNRYHPAYGRRFQAPELILGAVPLCRR